MVEKLMQAPDPQREVQLTPVTAMPATSNAALFQTDDLLELRDDLLQHTGDSFEAAEVLTAFLTSRGFGVQAEQARATAATIMAPSCGADEIAQHLIGIAGTA